LLREIILGLPGLLYLRLSKSSSAAAAGSGAP
jgi:hypothetical protein